MSIVEQKRSTNFIFDSISTKERFACNGLDFTTPTTFIFRNIATVLEV